MRTAMLTLLAAALGAFGQDRRPAESGKLDPEWNKKDETPTAFPDIKPIGPKELEQSVEKRLSPILEADPPLRKLQKARLRAALRAYSLDVQMDYNPALGRDFPRPEPMRTVALGRDVVTAAFDLSDRPEDRRPWLEFRVGVQKYLEALYKDQRERGVASPRGYYTLQQARLDAEIELLKFDRRK